MNKCLLFSFLVLLAFNVNAQTIVTDPINNGTITIEKDERIDILGEKMLAYNINLAKSVRSGRGYRLMLLRTNDRNMAMQLRSKLLQQFPEHKVYMIYQNPFIKLKMGNFVDKDEAENFKKYLIKNKLSPGNIYLVAETVEIKPPKEEEL